jgi:drug/metabolite transporter (DMT)-like permease
MSRIPLAGQRQRVRGSVYMTIAASCWSLAGILQRQLHMSLATQLAGRAVFASAAVLAFVAVSERGQEQAVPSSSARSRSKWPRPATTIAFGPVLTRQTKQTKQTKR